MPTKSGRFKLMKDRSLSELEQTITNAEQIGEVIGRSCGLMVNPFWELCAGIDAYFEKRKRKEQTKEPRDTDRALTDRALRESLALLKGQTQMDITVTITFKGKIDPADFKDGEQQMTEAAILEQILGEIEEPQREIADSLDLDFESVVVEQKK